MLRSLAPWATGVVRYRDHASASGRHARIVVPIRVSGVEVLAVVDTGAPWCVLGAELADLVAWAVPLTRCEPLVVRGEVLTGRLARVPVMFVADEGESLGVEATVFVPDDRDSVVSQLNFVGLGGALERIRFVVDPGRSLFGFGPLAD